jgi:hypothetical protein
VTVAGAEALPLQAVRMGTYMKVDGLMQGNRPLYQLVGSTVQYLFCWPGLGATITNNWLIGPSYTSGSSGIRSSDGASALCPDRATGWLVLSGTSYVENMITVAPGNALPRRPTPRLRTTALRAMRNCCTSVACGHATEVPPLKVLCGTPLIGAACKCIAGPYAFGALNADRCPAQTYYIGSEAECRAAGAALNLAWGAAMNSATVPRWCSASTTAVSFNAHPIGGAFVSARPVCLSIGTAAPTNAGDTNAPSVPPTIAGKGHATIGLPQSERSTHAHVDMHANTHAHAHEQAHTLCACTYMRTHAHVGRQMVTRDGRAHTLAPSALAAAVARAS